MTRRRPNPNRDIIAAAEGHRQLANRLEKLAPLMTEAVEHLHFELSLLGFPSQSSGVGEKVAGSSSGLTPTEAAAEFSWQLTSTREDLRDAAQIVLLTSRDDAGAIDLLQGQIDRARTAGMSREDRETVRKERGVRGMTVCKEGIHGKDGAGVPQQDGGWSDANCNMPAEKVGLCGACYHRYRRWRIRNDIDTSREFGPAA